MRGAIAGFCLLLLGAAGAGGWYFYSQNNTDTPAEESAFTVMTAAEPAPVFEAAGSPGLDSFYPLEDQLSDFLGPAQATTATPAAGTTNAMADVAVRAPAAGRTDRDAATTIMVGLDGLANLGGPEPAAISSGLYGGTVENTCDPERLISYLLNNPEKGRVWASVQAISFAELPGYIRALTPTVLTVDTKVINHGYDEQGYAIPIISTLAAGSAVLVDANGDVRARCYCGNPITPYTPPYAPPKCLTYHAVVYAEPGTIETKKDGVPRGVWATNQVTTRYDVDWVEVSWGVQTGWVRADEAKARYCKPEVEYRCVANGLVTSRPQTENYTGSLEQAWVEVVAYDIEGWTFVTFGGGTGWIPTTDVGPDSACVVDAGCVSSNVGVWTKPGESGTRISAPGESVRVEYTGELVGYPNPTHEKVVVTSPAPTQTGYLRIVGATDWPDTSCAPTVRCSTFDLDAYVYAESTGEEQIGGLWWASVNVLSGPTNGRYEIDFGGTRAWVDAQDLQGSGCEPWTQCIEIYGSIYEGLPTESGTRVNPGGFIRASFSGRIAIDATTTYAEFTAIDPVLSPNGSAWLETSKGFNTLDNSNCGMVPQCPPGYEWNGIGECVPPKCPDGQERTSVGACPPPPCPEGERLVFGDSIDSECCPIASLDSGLTGCTPPPCPGGQQLALNGECCPGTMIVSEGGVCVPPPCPSPQQTDIRGECCPTDYALSLTGECDPCLVPTEYDTNGRCCPTGQELGEEGLCITPPCPDGTPRNSMGICPPPVTCPSGQELLADGTCRVPPPTCPSGQELLADGTCRVRPPTCPAGQELLADGTCRIPPPVCTSGETLINNVCQPVECPVGFELRGGECLPIFCDDGYRLVGSECVPLDCPTGYFPAGDVCEPINCTDGFKLVGNECLPIDCPDGYVLHDGICEPGFCWEGTELVGDECLPIGCPTGELLNGGICTPIICVGGTELIGNECLPLNCPDGQAVQGDVCQPIICTPSFELVGNECVPITCPTGTELVDGGCRQINCLFGYTLVGNECVPIPCPEGTEMNFSSGQCEEIPSRRGQSSLLEAQITPSTPDQADSWVTDSGVNSVVRGELVGGAI